jgi:hypothetical protein
MADHVFLALIGTQTASSVIRGESSVRAITTIGHLRRITMVLSESSASQKPSGSGNSRWAAIA